MNRTLQIGLTGLIFAGTLHAASVSDYNVVWDSPSKNEDGSMPIGNGELAANVWVEPNGDLVFYISKSDAWSGNGQLLKLGRVRVKLDEPLFQEGTTFRQELDLEKGSIKIRTSNAQYPTSNIQLFVDANSPVIHIVIEREKEFEATAALEVWRTARRELTAREVYGLKGGPPVMEDPDKVFQTKDNSIRWCHRNLRSCYEVTLKNQHLGHLVEKYPDPLMNSTFGGLIAAEGMISKDDKTLTTVKPVKNLHLKIYAHTEQSETLDDWSKALAEIRKEVDKTSLKKAMEKHEEYWEEFWSRSWIYASGNRALTLPVNTHPWRVGVASNGRSRFGGMLTNPRIFERALSGEEIAGLAASPRTDDTKISEEALGNGCTVSAWINPAAGEKGRILDKCTAGKPDGFTFDAQPGLSLRWIVGDDTLIQPNCLKQGEWQHVAATVDTATCVRRIYLNGKLVKEEKGGGESSDAVDITRAYILQRWIQSCAGRGKYPIKFNGSLFTVAGNDRGRWNADYRRWGGCYWFQNTRLIYWSMLYSGDFDQMEPFWKMYRNALPLLKDRIKKYYDHDGIYCSETMYFWGTFNNANFGWGNKRFRTVNSYIRWYWDSGNELSMMLLDYYSITQNRDFVKDTLLPIADNVVLFYDQHYKRNEQGKVHFSPAMSLETWHSAEDPLPIIIGLKTVLTRLLELPEELTTDEQRKRWSRFLSELPAIPFGEEDGKKWIKPAHKYSVRRNHENPELYAVFPYRAYTQFKPDLEIALETWRRRLFKQTGGWKQDSIQAALLGLTNESRHYAVRNAVTKNGGSRFPAFWGPNFDWIPDQTHGSVTMIAFQRMIMQIEGDKIHLAPAWPKEWSGEFKLHAPGNTVVEGKIKGGKVIDLKVTPKSRMKDVVLPKPE
ncbi:MAG: hypothetical protein HN341_06745 [Verrucomicrobia bacterium]|jgi:hypothetical protein|nr:hypothetical protein [Verrucomicrobiota bacterium]